MLLLKTGHNNVHSLPQNCSCAVWHVAEMVFKICSVASHQNPFSPSSVYAILQGIKGEILNLLVLLLLFFLLLLFPDARGKTGIKIEIETAQKVDLLEA